MDNRRPEMLAGLPAETDQQNRSDPQDQAIGNDVADTDHLAAEAERKRQHHQRDPRPAIVHRARIDGHGLELTQEQKCRQHRDKWAMAVFGHLPGPEKLGNAFLEEQDRTPASAQSQPEHAPVQKGHACTHRR
jgi:hypothetical protein